MATKIRVTVYGVFRGDKFIAAFSTRNEAETVAAGVIGTCEIVPLTGKREERS